MESIGAPRAAISVASSARASPLRRARDRRIVAGAFGAAVPRQIIVGSVAIVLAVRLVVFLRMRDEIGEREAVMRGDEIDRARQRAMARGENIRRSCEPRRERAHLARRRRARSGGRRRAPCRSTRPSRAEKRRADSRPWPRSHGSAIWMRPRSVGSCAIAARNGMFGVEAVGASAPARARDRSENHRRPRAAAAVRSASSASRRTCGRSSARTLPQPGLIFVKARDCPAGADNSRRCRGRAATRSAQARRSRRYGSRRRRG